MRRRALRKREMASAVTDDADLLTPDGLQKERDRKDLEVITCVYLCRHTRSVCSVNMYFIINHI